MLNIGGGELLIILLVALIFLGPTRLPEVARQVGQTVASLRSLAQGFQSELEAAVQPDPLVPATAAAAPEPTDDASDTAEDKLPEYGASVTRSGDTAEDKLPEYGASVQPRTDPEHIGRAAREVPTEPSGDDGVSPGGPVDIRPDADEEE